MREALGHEPWRFCFGLASTLTGWARGKVA